jgi:asparagine synthase (glutamine-hydrolysing)
MCGIAGKLNFDGTPVDAAEIRHMTRAIVHRGPDDEGLLCQHNVGLGQRRLSVIDLRREGTAPLSNEQGSIWVVFNGEIYNFQKLRSDLIQRGHRFRTLTDTEVIVHLYEEHGLNCLDHLTGMFAFAVWDAPKGRIFAARDRLGEKPLIYARTERAFLFASTVSAVRAVPGVRSAPDYAAIDSYLTHQYVPSPRTAFEGIHKLPAAHYLTCDSSGAVSVTRYWSPAVRTSVPTDEGAIKEQLRTMLRESVRSRMIADVPLGAFLSGGLDSGTVVALMAEASPTPVKTFSVGFEEHGFNELPFARLVAQRYGTEHHELMVRPHMAGVIPALVDHYNEPFADSSALPTYYVSQHARAHVTVALSGDGGDESFAGYTHYRQLSAFRIFDGVSPSAVNRLCSAANHVTRRLPRGRWQARLERAVRMARAELPERYRIFRSIVKDEEKAGLYTRQFRALIGDQQPTAPWARVQPEEQLQWMMQHDLEHYLPDCLMVKTDVASMAHSLEVRCPLLDHSIVEFAASLPSRLKIRGGRGKWIFRETIKDLLPREVLAKPKTGFALPVSSWLMRDSGAFLRETLLTDRAIKRDLFKREATARLVEDQVTGRRDWSNRLWALLMLELWFQRFID